MACLAELLRVTQVEGVLFRVPRQPFVTPSSFFQATPDDGIVADGSDDAHPICLPENIKKSEFETMMKILRAKSYAFDERCKKRLRLSALMIL